MTINTISVNLKQQTRTVKRKFSGREGKRKWDMEHVMKITPPTTIADNWDVLYHVQHYTKPSHKFRRLRRI